MKYLGHVITPEGLKPNHKLIDAVYKFPSPMDVQETQSVTFAIKTVAGSYIYMMLHNQSAVSAPCHMIADDGLIHSVAVDLSGGGGAQ